MLWLSIRLAAALVTAPLPGAPFPFITVWAAIWVVALTALLGTLDAARRHELLLLANLGVRPETVGLLAGLPAAVAEILIGAWTP